MQLLRWTWFSALLAAGLAAQAKRSDSPPAPAVLVQTIDRASARQVLDWLDPSLELPELADGQNWRIILDQGDVRVETGSALVGWLQAEVRPGALGQALAEPRGRLRRAVRQALDALAPLGVGEMARDRLQREIDDLAGQVAMARLQVQSPLAGPRGLQVRLWLEPSPGTWLEELTSRLHPTRLGVPTLGDDPPLRVVVDAETRALGTVAARPLALLAALATDSEAAAVARAQAMDGLRSVLTGSMEWSWNPSTGVRRLLALLREPRQIAELYRSKEFAAAAAPQGFDPTPVDVAGEQLYRRTGVIVPGGEASVMLGGVAGAYLVVASAADEATAKDTLQALAKRTDLGGAIQREHSAKLTDLMVRARPRELFAAIRPDAELPLLPAEMELTLGSTGTSLFLGLTAQ